MVSQGKSVAKMEIRASSRFWTGPVQDWTGPVSDIFLDLRRSVHGIFDNNIIYTLISAHEYKSTRYPSIGF